MQEVIQNNSLFVLCFPAAAAQTVNIILVYFTISYDSQERLKSLEFIVLGCKLTSFVNKDIEVTSYIMYVPIAILLLTFPSETILHLK